MSASKKKEQVRAPNIRFPATDRLKQAFPSFQISTKSSNTAFFSLLLAIWTLLVLSFMQPEWVNQFRQVKNKGYDLMLAVDISDSMQALDFSTSTETISRLDVTKQVIGNFVKDRQGDRVGLVTFGEHAYLHVPLTLDTISVSKMLNDTTFGMAGRATAIGDAIGLSVRTLRNRPEGSRVLILLTDGEDNASSIPPLEAAKLAKQYGIRVYTIGVGKKGPVAFPNQFGGYGTVEMSIDEDLLKEIATMTGGQYFLATDKKALQSIYSTINTFEKSEANVKEFFIRDPLFHYPLALAMFLLLFLIIKPVYRRIAFGF